MKDVGIVQGSAEQAVPLVIGKTTVYVHTDIEKIEDEENHDLYQYHEVQYDKDEYIQMMAEQNAELNQVMNAMLGVNE